MVKLILFLFLDLLSLSFILNLTISHFLFKLNFSLVLIFLLFLSFIIKLCLFLLKFKILIALFFLTLFFSSFLLHLLIKLLFDFFLKLLFTHFFKLFLFLKQFSIEFNQSGPFIIIVSFNLINRFWCHWAGFWAFFWSWYLAFCVFLLGSLGWRLTLFFGLIISICKVLLGSLWFSPFGIGLF